MILCMRPTHDSLRTFNRHGDWINSKDKSVSLYKVNTICIGEMLLSYVYSNITQPNELGGADILKISEDCSDSPNINEYSPNLTTHPLNQVHFLHTLANA